MTAERPSKLFDRGLGEPTSGHSAYDRGWDIPAVPSQLFEWQIGQFFAIAGKIWPTVLDLE